MNDQLLENSPQVSGKNFKQNTINIGSHPENDIVIAGENVQPFHATLMKNNGSYQCVLLSPDASIAIDGKIYTDSPITVHEFEQLNIDGIDIMFQTSGPNEGLRVFVSQVMTGTAPEKYLVDDDNDPIVVEVKTPELEIDVEETAQFELEIVNGGPIVASFYVRVEGIPEEWVQIEPPIINLNEAQRSFVSILVTPPRDASSTAGLHDINLVVSSPNYYGHKIEKPLKLTIHPFYQFALGSLSPRQKRIPWRKKRGTTFLPITNESNDTANFNVMSFDEENGCSFEFKVNDDLQLNRQATIPIPAGTHINLPIEIRPLKPKVFAMQSKQYYYTTNVQIQEQGISPQTISGVAISQPLFGWWSIVLTVLTILITLFIVLQPRINSFGVAAGKDIIELGDSTRLEWSVSPFATRVSITELDSEISRGQTSITVTPSKSTTYELVSGNWLSGLIGMDYVRKETVLVVPPAPKIGVFEVDKLQVDKGSPIKLRWSATEVDELNLTVDNVVYPLDKANFSGEQEFVLEDDAIITLEGKNASGSELRSYFVDVVPPQIDVIEFTVWVQPATSGNRPYQPRLGMSQDLFEVSDVPDPNFPERLVSLVPDVESESGYRVEFYQPNRELAKGEQIMLQWKINGVDNVQIAPFGEELPSQGLQPFFPQESMNFVLTAKSGELQQIFMLPVKVFDGVPPVAPTIEFFKASPTKMVGSGNVEFTWSVSGEWTNVQLLGADGVIENYLFAQGFHSLKVTQSSTFILTAWNGDLSSSASVEITVDPSLIAAGVKITDAYPTGLFMIGGKTLVTIDFFDIPSDKPDPTGQVIITDGTSSCTIALPSKSCSLVFTTPGDKTLYANYQGDSIYLQADSVGFPESGSGTKITVQSATVNLVPSYAFLQSGAEIADITNASLSLDQGLNITVEVQPSLTLPDDNKSSVNLQICDQVTDPITQEVSADENTCQFIGGGTVQVAAPPLEAGQVQGYGYANIILQKFPSSGTKVFVFNYIHEDNAFEPATEEQFNISIDPTEIYLNPAICDPNASTTFTDCSIGVLESAAGGKTEKVDIIFDIYKTSDDKMLSSVLAEPNASLFSFSEIGSTETWTCGTKKINGYWKLVCNGAFSQFSSSGLPVNITHTGSDNNYTIQLGAPPYDTEDFDIAVLYKTSTVIGNISVAAGQTVRITGQDGVITFWNGTTQLNTTTNPLSGALVLSETTDIDGLIGVNSASNCEVGTDDNKIYVTTIAADCDIYFTQAGNFTLKAEYLGNGDLYAASTSNDKNIQITKENDVKASWTLPTNVTAGTTTTVRIDLSVSDDDAANNHIFSPWVFDGKQLQINLLNAGTNCVVMADSENDNGYLMDINTDPSDNTVDPWVEFNFVCHTHPLDITFTASFPDVDANNFAISSTKEASTSVTNTPTISMTLTASGATGTVGPVTQSTYPTTTPTFYAGVTYQFSFKVQTIYGSYYHSPWYNYGLDSNQAIINAFTASDGVSIQFPQALKDSIDWNKSSCGANQSSPKAALKNATILDQQAYNLFDISWGWVQFTLETNPNDCYFVFTNTVDTSTLENTKYEYVSDYQSYYTNTIAVKGPNVDKQKVTLDLTGLPAITDTQKIAVPLDLTINLTEEFDTEISPLSVISSGTFDSYLSITTTCGTISNKSIVNGNRATFTITNSNYDACNKDTINITYTGNSYYSSDTTSGAVSYSKHNSKWGAVSSADEELLNNVNTSGTPDSTVSIQVLSDSTTPNFNVTPGGYVYIQWRYEESGKAPKTYIGNDVDYLIYNCSATCTWDGINKRYVIEVVNGVVEFLLDLQVSPANGEHHYLYYWYSGDGVFNNLPKERFGPFNPQ
ncbi:hypothetical protein KQH54_02190 [bacterium]|nr:hypothetical protein [bacterium]